MLRCPSDNTLSVDQSSFWSSGTLHWDAHRIGWAIAGACTLVTLIISVITVLSHCRNYTNPKHQRQIIRILYMPPVYAVISFLSYRFFRDYTYFSFVEVVYEAVTLSAFLLLLIQFVADKATTKDHLLEEKSKRKLLFPFCCWRYRPTKPYFMHAIKWSVLQYVIVRPAVSVVGMICQAKGILCESEGFNVKFANVYLEAIDFSSISIALYGLLLFYSITSEDLKGKKPLAKFLCIKLIVMFTWYQSFVFSALQSRVIHGTEFWTATNISDGLNALTICIEMIFFSIFMWLAYSPKEYERIPGTPATSIWRPLWDSINFCETSAPVPDIHYPHTKGISTLADFAIEIITSAMYFLGLEKHVQSYSSEPGKTSFDSAFILKERSPGLPTGKASAPALGSNPEGIPLSKEKVNAEAED